MKFQFLGTAAAEGVPGIFCNCPNCRRSRQIGGRALRTRSQAIIDDTLLIDFPADTFAHTLTHHVDLMNVRHCLITHRHQDHLYPQDLNMLKSGFAHVPEGYCITFYGADKVKEAVQSVLDEQIRSEGRATFIEIKPFETFSAGKYTVTALPALHDPNASPVFYQITDGEKCVLYAHDTYYFSDQVWDYFEQTKPHFDLISLDCTSGSASPGYGGHMGLPENVEVRSRMLDAGYASEKTIFVCNHFSHQSKDVVYDDLVPIAARENFLVSYDGLQIML